MTSEKPPGDETEIEKPFAPTKKRSPAGSKFNMYHTNRQVTLYAIHETELRYLTMLNTTSSILFSVGTFLASIAISIWVGTTLASGVDPGILVICNNGGFALAFFSIVAYGFGACAVWRSRSEIQTIKDSVMPRD